VSEHIPPDDTVTEDVAEEVPVEESLAAKVLRLQEAHRVLDQEIDELYQFPYRDQLLLQRLKKKKLLLKDAIARFKGDLIPDWNA
jgi:hypothetical protein